MKIVSLVTVLFLYACASNPITDAFKDSNPFRYTELLLDAEQSIESLINADGHRIPEELLSHINTGTGENPNDLIRAEIVYAKLPKGGEIFSVGSICFCGSLNHNNGKNGISQMLENVVRRFANL